jgi:hypothetical protein
MANRQSECIKVRNSAFSIRLDLLGTFCIKAKGAEEKSMAKGGKLHQGKRCDRKVNGKRWENKFALTFLFLFLSGKKELRS